MMLAVLASVVLAQDGGVWVYRRAVLELESGDVVTVDAGVALDGPVALARANELEAARARPPEAPAWVATVAAVVVSVVWVADRVREWTRPP